MTLTSYLDFLITASIEYDKQDDPKRFRYGQIYMNLLAERMPNIANVLVGTLDDPFYRDSVPPHVHNKVAELWANELDSRMGDGASA